MPIRRLLQAGIKSLKNFSIIGPRTELEKVIQKELKNHHPISIWQFKKYSDSAGHQIWKLLKESGVKPMTLKNFNSFATVKK